MASRCHVLIVEDDPLIVDVLVASLELEYRVSSVNTVGAALAFLRTSHVDVVLIDSILPDGRGTEVACFADGLGAAVIEMSGYPHVMEDLEHSARPHLLKPFGVQVLLSTIGHALRSVGGSVAGTDGILTLRQPRRDIMTYRRMPALVVALGVSLTAAWCTLLV